LDFDLIVLATPLFRHGDLLQIFGAPGAARADFRPGFS